MSKYDTPHSTLETHPEEEKNILMDFAVSTQFKDVVTGPPLNTPSYNNPLASISTVENLSTFYDTPGTTGNINNLSTSLKICWARSNWLPIFAVTLPSCSHFDACICFNLEIVIFLLYLTTVTLRYKFRTYLSKCFSQICGGSFNRKGQLRILCTHVHTPIQYRSQGFAWRKTDSYNEYESSTYNF